MFCAWEERDMKPKADQPPLAYEPSRTDHREAKRRRQEVQEWLKRREWGLDAAPIVADVQPTDRERPTRS